MSLIVAWMKGIMLVAGVLTCTMVYAVIAPQAALQSTFGDTLHGPLPEIVVRNWGALITLVGAMLLLGGVPSSEPSAGAGCRGDQQDRLHSARRRAGHALPVAAGGRGHRDRCRHGGAVRRLPRRDAQRRFPCCRSRVA